MIEPMPPRPFAVWPWAKPTPHEREALFTVTGKRLVQAIRAARSARHKTLLVSMEVWQLLRTLHNWDPLEDPHREVDAPVLTTWEALQQDGITLQCGVSGLHDAQVCAPHLAPPWGALTVLFVRRGAIYGRTVLSL